MTPDAERARRAKISASLKGRPMSPEHKAKISATVRAKRAASHPGRSTPTRHQERTQEAYREAVEARKVAATEYAVLEARIALLYEVLNRLENELLVSHERSLQAQSDEYAAKLRCGS